MKKNAGLTLVELVTVIGLMSVVIAVLGLSFNAVTKQRVSSAAGDVKEQLQTAQTIAMSKRECYVEVTKKDGKVVFTTYATELKASDESYDGTETRRKKVASVTIGSGVEVLLSGDPTVDGDGDVTYSGISDHVITEGEVFCIRYTRATGAFKNATRGANPTSPESYAIGKITFRKGNGNEASLILSKLTGKVSYGD